MTERKGKHIGRWITGVVFLLLSALYCYVSLSVSAEIPLLTEYSRSRLSEGIDFSTYEKLPDDAYRKKLAVYTVRNTEFSNEIGEVKPVLVNEKFFEVYNIHVGGSGITKQYVESHIPAVVISREEADRMSLDGNVIGQQLSLYGKDFTIVGIYTKPEGFLHEISSDIYDRVYIPYTCYEGYSELGIDTFAAPKGTYAEKALSLLGMTETDTNFYLKNELSVKHDIIRILLNWYAVFVAIILLIIAVKYSRNRYRQIVDRMREALAQYNYRKAMKGNRWFVYRRIMVSIILLALPVALLIIFPPKLVLTAPFIPLDNIFDLSHYADTFKAAIQLMNTGLSTGDCYYSALFRNTFAVCLGLYPVIMLLGILWLRQINLFGKMFQKPLNENTI